MTNRVHLSIVIPTYNEASRLPQTIREIIPFLQKLQNTFEVIIVDDSSPDGTGSLVLELAKETTEIRLLMQKRRLGKGAAVRRGCLEATGDFVLFMDADHSTPIAEAAEFLKAIGDSPCCAVAGVRTYQDDECKWRRVVGLIGQLAAHVVVFKKAVVDSQCGFKMFTREAVKRIFPQCRLRGGMLDVEIFYLIHKYNITCKFIPVMWKNKPNSRINIFLCILKDPIDLLRIRINNLLGLYTNNY